MAVTTMRWPAIATQQGIFSSKKEEHLAENAASAAPPAPHANPTECPVLLCGTGFNKVCVLKSNMKVTIGRSSSSQVIINDPGVSNEHCLVRWDHHARMVELKDRGSGSGTIVNSEVVHGTTKRLSHGDRIRLQGKTQPWDFILDLRPVLLGFEDPRNWPREEPPASILHRQGGHSGLSQLRKRRDILRLSLTNLEVSIKQKESDSFETERSFYEALAGRKVRASENLRREEQLKLIQAEYAELSAKLTSSREDWMVKLKEEFASNDGSSAVVVKDVKQLQDKIDRLQLKKVELERTLHPERYAVVDIITASKGEPVVAAVSHFGLEVGHEGDDDEEEEAFLGVAPAPAPPSVVAPPAEGVVEDPGDDSEDEPLVKRQKTED